MFLSLDFRLILEVMILLLCLIDFVNLMITFTKRKNYNKLLNKLNQRNQNKKESIKV